VLEVLADLFLSHGPPEHIRSDNVLYTERNTISSTRPHRIV